MKRYTETSEGFIAHIEVFTNYGVIHAPVKLDLGPKRAGTTDSRNRPRPLRRSTGSLVYALPGGEEFVP